MEYKDLDERQQSTSGVIYCEINSKRCYTEAAFLSRFEEISTNEKNRILSSLDSKKSSVPKGNGLLYKEIKTGYLRCFELSYGEYSLYPGLITDIAHPTKKNHGFSR